MKYCWNKIGGVLKPNDGKCHLDSAGMYQESLTQDYPSLGHISRLVQDYAINLIFAITEDVSSTYSEFSLHIPGKWKSDSIQLRHQFILYFGSI